MELINLTLHDNEFENKGYTNKRLIARAFVLNEENKISLLHIVGDDIFGHRDYYETSGGGVDDGEAIEEAIIRELDEEIGYRCEIIKYLGVINDEYNLINRLNENHYFLCKIVKKTKIHHVSFGDSLIIEICWLDIDEILQRYEAMNKTGIARLVRQREYVVAKKVKEILNGGI